MLYCYDVRNRYFTGRTHCTTLHEYVAQQIVEHLNVGIKFDNRKYYYVKNPLVTEASDFIEADVKINKLEQEISDLKNMIRRDA